MTLRKMGWEVVDWVHLTYDRTSIRFL